MPPKKQPSMAERYLQGLRRKYGIKDPPPVAPYISQEERTAQARAPNTTLEYILDILSRPSRAIAGGIRAGKRGENILSGIGKGFTGESRYDVSETMGVEPGIKSFATDVLTDPITFLTGGTGKVIKGGLKGMSYKLSRAGEKLLAKDATKYVQKVERIWRRSSAAKSGVKPPSMAFINYGRTQAKNVLIDAIDKGDEWALKYLSKPGTKISVPGLRDIIGEPRIFGGLDVPVAKAVAIPFKYAGKVIGQTPVAKSISKAIRGITIKGKFGKIYRELPTEHQVRFNYLTKDFTNEVKDLSNLMYRQGRSLGYSKANARALVGRHLMDAIESESVTVMRQVIKPDIKAAATAQAKLAQAVHKATAARKAYTRGAGIKDLTKAKAELMEARRGIVKSKPKLPTKASIKEDIMMEVRPMAEDLSLEMKNQLNPDWLDSVKTYGIEVPVGWTKSELISEYNIPRHYLRGKASPRGKTGGAGLGFKQAAGYRAPIGPKKMDELASEIQTSIGGREAWNLSAEGAWDTQAGLNYLKQFFNMRKKSRRGGLKTAIDEIMPPYALAEEIEKGMTQALAAHKESMVGYTALTKSLSREIKQAQKKLSTAKAKLKTVEQYEASLPALQEAFQQSKKAVIVEDIPETVVRSKELSTLSPEMQIITKKYKDITDKLYTAEQMLPPSSEKGYLDAYVAHMVSKEGKQFLKEKHLLDAQNTVASQFKTKLGNHLHRSLPGTITEINDRIRELIKTGKLKTARKMTDQELAAFKFFQDDPMETLLQRGVSSVKAQSNTHFVNDSLFFFSHGKVMRPVAKTGESAIGFKHAEDMANDKLKSLIRELPGKPEQYKTFESLDKKWVHILDADIANDLDKWTSFKDKDAAALMHTIQRVTSWWKATATGMRPAFHVRNLTSNIFNAWLGGTISPKPYMQAMWIQRRMPTTIKIGGKDVAGDEILQLARQEGVMGQGFMHNEVYLGEVGARKLIEGPKAIDWIKLHDMQKFPVSRAGRVVGESIEDSSKLAVFIDRLTKGDTIKEAAAHVHKYLFNYLDLTHFERRVMRNIFPFYTWSRKNIPLQLESLVKQPGKYAAITHAKTAIEGRVSGDIPAEELPPFIREQFGIKVKSDNGKIRYFLLGGWMPASDISNLEVKTLLEMLHPALKTVIEQSINRSIFLDKQIERYPGEPGKFLGVEMSRKTINFWRNIVILNEIDRIVFRNPDESTTDKLMNTIVRTYPIDPVRAKKSYYYKLGAMIQNYKKTIATGEKFLSQQTIEEIRKQLEDVQSKQKVIKQEALEMDPEFMRRPRKSPAEKEINKILRNLLR